MAVAMQAFYWDSPIKEQREGEWWNLLAEKAPELASRVPCTAARLCRLGSNLPMTASVTCPQAFVA
jgi:hypothetical protein